MEYQNIPFCRAQIDESEISAVVEVLKSGWITTGKITQEFEAFAKTYLGVEHAIAVSSCTAALHLSLLALDIGPGDEVITTPLTFAATVNTIIHVGATPILADICMDSGNILIEEIEKKITSRTKAIIPVHYAGLPCDLNKLETLAKKHGVKIIEDAAHAIGSSYRGRKIGSSGNLVCFSFYPTKTMTSIEGGLIACSDSKVAEKIRNMSLHGLTKNAWSRYTQIGNWKYDVIFPGFKYNMSDVQAAVGLAQFKKLDSFIQKRRLLVAEYRNQFKDNSKIEMQSDDLGHSYHLFIIRLASTSKLKRDELIAELTKKNIGTAVNFIPIPMHTYYKKTFGFDIKDYPNCDKFYEGVVSLPLFPELTIEQVRHVSRIINELVV